MISCFSHYLWAWIPEMLERNFGKLKEDFVKNNPIQKNLSHFFTGVMVWNIQMDLYNLFFRFKHLMISCFSHYLWVDPETLERNFGKLKEDFFKNEPIHKNLSQFCNIYHDSRDMMLSLTLFSRKLIPIS
jgi:hypothetical protein